MDTENNHLLMSCKRLRLALWDINKVALDIPWIIEQRNYYVSSLSWYESILKDKPSSYSEEYINEEKEKMYELFKEIEKFIIYLRARYGNDDLVIKSIT